MKGFRATGTTSSTTVSPDPHCGSQQNPSTQSPSQPGNAPLVSRIVHDLANGKTTSMVAHDYGLPLDFVTLVLDRARQQGNLDFFELKPGSCTKGACDPDPESLVCAGCPIMPAAVRRKQSLVGKLLHR